MIDFNKFNEMFPADQMKKQMDEAAKNDGTFDKMPDGEYTVSLDKMELGESQKGQLMLKAQFRIIKGDHANQCIFVNKVLTGTRNDGFMMRQARLFLESLDSGIDYHFDGWEEFDSMIADMADAIREDGLSYVVSLTANAKKPEYQDFEVIDIIES